MEDKVKQITNVCKSPGHEKHEGYNVKVHSKFKKTARKMECYRKA